MVAKRVKAPLDPTGITEVDKLQDMKPVTLDDYIHGVSAYIRASGGLPDKSKKAPQIRLSNALARAVAAELETRLPNLRGKLTAEEKSIAGALRTARADVSEIHPLDGLRLAIELKPVNLAVGRAIWNRFGDIRAFAVNVHLKFPFCIVGGVLVVPTFEFAKGKLIPFDEDADAVAESNDDTDAEGLRKDSTSVRQKSTIPLIQKTIERLKRAGRRRTEADAAHHLESICVIVFDPDKSALDSELPPIGSGLRWSEFLDEIALAYKLRFED